MNSGNWIAEIGKSCWGVCGSKGGSCQKCNRGSLKAYCCRGDGTGGNGDCPSSALNSLKSVHMHICVRPISDGKNLMGQCKIDS